MLLLLEIQQAAIWIEGERTLIDSNRGLIEPMQPRIEETMARVWN